MARFVEQAAATLADMGFARMPARVLMLLMATEERGLTAADLAAGLQVSPAAVSNAVRYLMQVGLAEREAVPGARRDLYRLPDDTWYAASGAKQPAYRKLADVASQGIAATGGPGTPAGARLSDMQSFFDYLDTEIPSYVRALRPARDEAGHGRTCTHRPSPPLIAEGCIACLVLALHEPEVFPGPRPTAFCWA